MQEDVTELQHSNSKWEDLGTQFSQMTATLKNLNDKAELSRQPIFHLVETLAVSLHEPDIIITHNEKDEAEKEIEVISKRLEEPQKESKEDQPLVLVKPPSLPFIPVEFKKGVVVKERSLIFYTADTFVSDDHYVTESYVLEVPDELLNLKEGMPTKLPKAIDASFVVNISKGEGIM
ncbi:hypothetical protein Sjap_020005 [Stephania japonica]|uniref:Uncharacterized protein n=1 Tax=Stephania japonica TaxID=461633 RepID=A0AAP0HZW9_9MAGN